MKTSKVMLSAESTAPFPGTLIGAAVGEPSKAATRRRKPGLSRDKILLVATRMFAEEGFAATSVRDIARACGITLPTIYHFFGDKRRLYDECVAACFDDASHRMAAAINSTASPQENLENAAVALCDMLLNQQNLRRLLQREMLRRDFEDFEGAMVDYFPEQFVQVTDEVRKLGVTTRPDERAFALYALALGMVQFRNVADRVGIDPGVYNSPVHLAVYVLRTILPEVR